MITKFLRIATFAVLTALTIGGNCLCPAQAAKTDTSEATSGTAAGAKSAPVVPAAEKPAAPSSAAPAPSKVDANVVPSKEQGFAAHESQAPLMTDDQRNALYFQWIGAFIMITGSIIGFIIYKARPPKPGPDMSLDQASDAYDGPKQEATTSAPENEKKAVDAGSGGSETTGTETKESTEPASSSPAEAASSDSESKAEDKNTPATG